LRESVRCYAIAATSADVNEVGAASGPSTATTGTSTTLPGDGLVPVASALGQHADPRFTLLLQPDDCWIAPATGHLDLLSSLAVYERLRDWLAG
jgi:hypothetical protein